MYNLFHFKGPGEGNTHFDCEYFVNEDRQENLVSAINRLNYFLSNDLVCSRWQLISFRADARQIFSRRGVALVIFNRILEIIKSKIPTLTINGEGHRRFGGSSTASRFLLMYKRMPMMTLLSTTVAKQ